MATARKRPASKAPKRRAPARPPAAAADDTIAALRAEVAALSQMEPAPT